MANGPINSRFPEAALVERVAGERLALLLVAGERQQTDQAIGDVGRARMIGRKPMANDLGAAVQIGANPRRTGKPPIDWRLPTAP